MTLFSSGKHAKLTADTHPWLHAHASENCRDTGDRLSFNNGIGNVFEPRPEFDRPLTNPANPILVAFRSIGVRPAHIAGFVTGIEGALSPDDPPGVREPVEHARAVLTRLTNLTTKEA